MMTNQELFDNKPKVKRKKLNVLPPNPQVRDTDKAVGPGRFPSWLHRKLPRGGNLWETNRILDEDHLPTVCEEAKCPNLLECYSKKTATFLVFGSECTRSCGFCDIDHNKKPKQPDAREPGQVALAAKRLGLKHIVITMVARDDLKDGGAKQLVLIMDEVREQNPECTIEILTSDFEGNEEALDIIIDAKPDIFNHNIETAEELTPRVRHKATYSRTLHVLRYVKEKNPYLVIKSGIMVGLGETEEQVKATIDDLHHVGCSVVTIGQYLQPDSKKLRVKSFVTPQQFKAYEDYGHSIGINQMYCGPFVRSSYNADLIQRRIKSI